MVIIGNGFGFWKTMPMTRRTRTGSTSRVVDVLAGKLDAALGAGTAHLLVHAIEAANDGALAAAGRPDDGRHLVGPDGHGHALDRLALAVPGTQVADIHPLAGGRDLAVGGVGGRRMKAA